MTARWAKITTEYRDNVGDRFHLVGEWRELLGAGGVGMLETNCGVVLRVPETAADYRAFDAIPDTERCGPCFDVYTGRLGQL